MASFDAIYTPRPLADELLSYAEKYRGGMIVDPCAGEGALLEAAQRRFGATVEIGALDIRASVGRHLRRVHPGWTVSTADLLNPLAVRSSAVARAARGRTELLLLNPPFSYRGLGGIQTEIAGRSVTTSPALAFVLHALAQFGPSSGALCILPMGSVFGERNAGIWGHLHGKYSIDVLRELPADTFPGRRARTVLARVGASTTPRPLGLGSLIHGSTSPWDGCTCVDLVRGRVPRHLLADAREGVTRYVHTTDLSLIEQDEVFEWQTFAPTRLATAGPMIVIARVGKYRSPVRLAFSEAVLSDCVIGLRPLDPVAEPTLFGALNNSGAALASLYIGTGAPYVTVKRLLDKLRGLGWNPRHVSASAPAPDCTCRADVASAAERAIAV